jgi:hypothetical protein
MGRDVSLEEAKEILEGLETARRTIRKRVKELERTGAAPGGADQEGRDSDPGRVPTAPSEPAGMTGSESESDRAGDDMVGRSGGRA